MAEIKLNPCPFCGEKPDIIRVSEHSFFAECKGDKCRAVIFTYGHTPEQAAEKWNSRTEQPKEQKRGRWLKIEPSGTQFRRKCSECGGIVHAVSDFCPFCGACMDAGDDQSGGVENAVT